MYYNNRNRNLTQAYEETVKEQSLLKEQLLLEEMGTDTIKGFEKISNDLAKVQSDVEAYYKELKARYDFNSNEEMVKMPKSTVSFVKSFFNRIFNSGE